MRAALAKNLTGICAVTRVLAGTLLVTASVAGAQVTVSLTEPANGSMYVPPVNITLSAAASAGHGYTVSKVEFFNGITTTAPDTTTRSSNDKNEAQALLAALQAEVDQEEASPNS